MEIIKIWMKYHYCSIRSQGWDNNYSFVVTEKGVFWIKHDLHTSSVVIFNIYEFRDDQFYWVLLEPTTTSHLVTQLRRPRLIYCRWVFWSRRRRLWLFPAPSRRNGQCASRTQRSWIAAATQSRRIWRSRVFQLGSWGGFPDHFPVCRKWFRQTFVEWHS